MSGRSVLCAIDFSSASDDAMQFAADEARMRDATLDIVHVWTPASLPLDPIGFSSPDDNEAEARRALESLQLPRCVKKTRKHLLCGLPRDCVAELAGRLHSDMLVVGSHSQPRLARWLLGSVAESLTRVAPCPVVVVRPRLEREDVKSPRSAVPLAMSIVTGGF